jgi:hypothetical protein
MKFAKKIHSIICDDVREEKNNKFSLMGIYGNEIIFNKVPAILPKLCFLLMIEDVKERFHEVTIALKLPSSEAQIFKRPGMPEGVSAKNYNYILGISPFRVEETGEAKFNVYFDNSKRPNYAHRFMIKKMKKPQK